MSKLPHDVAQNRFDHSRTPHEAAERWQADPGSLTHIQNGINHIYRIEIDGQGVYLRFMHAARKSQATTAMNMDYLAHLHRRGAPVCPPAPTADGRIAIQVQAGPDPFIASAVREVPGQHVEIAHVTAHHMQAWGLAMAQLHRAAEDYPEAQHECFFTWQAYWQEIETWIYPDDDLAWGEYHAVNAELDSLPLFDMGLTHGDLHSGNILWDGEKIWIIDFDEPVYQWFAADAARPFIELTDRPLNERRALLDAFLSGYRQARPFSPQQAQAMPWLARMKLLDQYAWSPPNWDPVPPDSPEAQEREAWLEHYRRLFRQPLEW